MNFPAKRLLAVLLIGAVIAVQTEKARAISVFDGANYSQNLLTAVRTLQMINNQIEQLQNEANMLMNMARNLERLDYSSVGQLRFALAQVNLLMQRAEGIAFEVAQTEAEYAEHYPREYNDAVTNDQLVQHARTRWDYAMEAYRDTLVVQAQVAQNVAADDALLGELVAQSQAAGGNLQVSQASNQLIALQVRQQMQTQQLLAAQFRAEALDEARRTAAEEQARTAFQRFLGSSDAYTPLP